MRIEWTAAGLPNFEHVIAGLRHRLANAAAPLGILVELCDDEVGTDLVDASRNSVTKLERILSLLGVIGNRGVGKPRPFDGITIDIDLEGMPAAWQPLAWILQDELGPDAAVHGATAASLVYVDGELVWRDNGSGFTQDVLEHFGLPQPEGNHGCGLGLLSVTLTAGRVGADAWMANDRGAVLRFTPRSGDQA